MSREYEEYLKEEKQLYDKKKQFKWQIRKDLNDQINSRKYIIVSAQYIIVSTVRGRGIRFHSAHYC